MFSTSVRSANLALAGIIAGIYVNQVIGWPGVERFPGPAYVRYHQELDREFARAMPIVGNAALLSGIAAVGLRQGPRSRALSAVALGCGIAEVALTVTKNVPLNTAVQSWSPEAPPEDWAEVRDRWMRGHRARTVLSLIGLGCQIAATMSTRPAAA